MSDDEPTFTALAPSVGQQLIDLTGLQKKRTQTTLSGVDPAGGAKSQKTQTCLTNRQKLLILDELDKTVSSAAAVCVKYNVHRNTVSNWKKNRGEIEQQVEEEGRAEKKRALAEDADQALPKDLRLPLTRGTTDETFGMCLHL